MPKLSERVLVAFDRARRDQALGQLRADFILVRDIKVAEELWKLLESVEG